VGISDNTTQEWLKNKRITWYHLLFHFTSYVLSMFRKLIYPSSGACDCSIELPHWSIVLGSMCVGESVWLGWSGIRVAGWNMDTTPTQPHQNSNTHRTKNSTANVVIQHNSRRLLMMCILMSETCWAYKKWNKITSDIKLVFYSSNITLMHSPMNVRFTTQKCPNRWARTVLALLNISQL